MCYGKLLLQSNCPNLIGEMSCFSPKRHVEPIHWPSGPGGLQHISHVSQLEYSV